MTQTTKPYRGLVWQIMAFLAAKCRAIIAVRQGGSAPDTPPTRYVVSYSSHDGAHATLLRVVWTEQHQAEAHAADLRETLGITDVVVGEGV